MKCNKCGEDDPTLAKGKCWRCMALEALQRESTKDAILADGVTALEMVQEAGTFVPPIMVAWLEKAKEVLK